MQTVSDGHQHRDILFQLAPDRLCEAFGPVRVVHRDRARHLRGTLQVAFEDRVELVRHLGPAMVDRFVKIRSAG